MTHGKFIFAHTGNFAGTGELFMNGKSVGKVDMWIYNPGGSYPIPG